MDHLADDTLPILTNGTNRRRFIQASALTAAGAAVLAACSTKDNPTQRIGTVPSTTTLPPAPVNDVTLLRTSSSLEYLLISVYDLAAEQQLFAADHVGIAAKMRADHEADADTFAELTTEAGGDVYACANVRMFGLYVKPALVAILGSTAAAAALGIPDENPVVPPSTDPDGDTMVLLNALERIVAATQQSYVATYNDIAVRAAGITIGVSASRRGALWGALINPDALVDASVLETVSVPTAADDAAAETTETSGAPATTTAAAEGEAQGEGADETTSAPLVHAVSSTFGQLAPVQIEIGAPDENDLRLIINIETPYLNSMIYEYMGTCPA